MGPLQGTHVLDDGRIAEIPVLCDADGRIVAIAPAQIARLAVTPEVSGTPAPYKLWTAASSEEIVGIFVTINAANADDASGKLEVGYDDVMFLPLGSVWAPNSRDAVVRIDHIAVCSTDSGGMLPGTTSKANVASRMVTHTFPLASAVRPIIVVSSAFKASRFAYTFIAGRQHA